MTRPSFYVNPIDSGRAFTLLLDGAEPLRLTRDELVLLKRQISRALVDSLPSLQSAL